ncbi:2-hydroxyacyl-CoA dehydratase [Massiliimalia timonensis]|uniref:2-hydroxyacyl-CoA dehydratase n=1 Tax=Massiliimalia timonensis TaxID=1987501 RepID=UPI000B8B3EE6|nr:2-hydroxyacyl-CoA dehydratase [Massiliimalia timonensis]MBS7175474.1 2-hydroxyacyl-CoA dehydratase [Clostridiales bacterium]
MYRIQEGKDREKNILLIPAMLDAHFPLLQYAFYSKNYHPIILENEDNITDMGLRYVHNDMCYPSILCIGQMLSALQSGKYDLSRTRLLMPSAGDGCRGSNYTSLLRKALKNAGFPQVKVLSLNVKGVERENQMKLEPGMVWRALFGLFYGDMLMLLLQQVRPYEKVSGTAQACWKHWVRVLSEDLRTGRNLTLRSLKRNFLRIAEDFSNIERTGKTKQRIGIVGELYIKYCHLGNWDMVRFLEEEGCESYTNGLSWYTLYYIDSHLRDSRRLEKAGYRLVGAVLERLQKKMIQALRRFGFYSLEPFSILKEEAKGYVSYSTQTGDGWLIGAEAVGCIKHGCRKVAAVQPFGCLPNHVCGKGIYSSLCKRLPDGLIVSVDVDSSGSRLNVYNRVKMLLDFR